MKKRKNTVDALPLSTYTIEKYHAVILLVFALLLYGNTLFHDFALDDGIYIQNHETVQRGVPGIPAIFLEGSTYGFNQLGGQQPYRPVPLASFALGKSLFDNHPGWEHAINVGLYGILGLVLFQLLRYWLPTYHVLIRMAIVMLFLAHPVHTEVVANIKSRDEIFCFLFGALSLVHLHKYTQSKRVQYGVYSCVLFLLALLSKESGLSLLLVVPLVLYTFEKRSVLNSIRILPPYLLVAVVYVLIRQGVIQTPTAHLPPDIINNVLHGADSFAEKSATIVALLGEYLRLLVFPHPLSWDYSYNQFPLVGWDSMQAGLSLLLHLGLLYLAISRIIIRDVIGFCILFYALTLAVTSNIFFLNGSTLGERFLFMPSWAFCILLPVSLTKWTKLELRQWKPRHRFGWLAGMSSLILLGSILTINRNGDWKNNLSLFEAGVQAAPNSARTHASLAFEYKQQALATDNPELGRAYLQKAEAAFDRSLEIYPAFEYALYNFGVFYLELGVLERAEHYFRELLKIVPDHENGLNNLGVALFRQQRYPAAIPYFERLLQVNPQHHQALTNLGASYFNLNEMAKALPYYEKSLELQENNSAAYGILVKIHQALGQPEKAAQYTALQEGLH